jgi:transcriptional/translational regulatory protein YebC/TACO1
MPRRFGNSNLMRQSADEALRRVQFEAYGPGGTAVLIDCVTAQRERTAAVVREVLTRHGGLPGASGAVAYLFNEVGLIRYPSGTPAEPLTRDALRAGAEDVVVSGAGACEVLTDPRELESVLATLTREGWTALCSGVTRRAASPVKLDAEDAAALARLVQALREVAGVRSVYTNGEISNAVLAGV